MSDDSPSYNIIISLLEQGDAGTKTNIIPGMITSLVTRHDDCHLGLWCETLGSVGQ